MAVRELNQQTGKVLRRVALTGERLIITDRGRPVAMLVPLPRGHYRQLVEAGLVRSGADDVRPVPRARLDRPSSEILAELGEESV